MATSRSGSRYPGGRSRTPSTNENMAVLAPIPTARLSTTMQAKARSRRRARIAYRNSLRIVCYYVAAVGWVHLFLHGHDAQAPVIGHPLAMPQQVLLGIALHQPEKLGMARRRQPFGEVRAEHREPILQAGGAAFQRGGPVEHRHQGHLQAVALQQRGVLANAREVPRVVALRVR